MAYGSFGCDTLQSLPKKFRKLFIFTAFMGGPDLGITRIKSPAFLLDSKPFSPQTDYPGTWMQKGLTGSYEKIAPEGGDFS